MCADEIHKDTIHTKDSVGIKIDCAAVSDPLKDETAKFEKKAKWFMAKCCKIVTTITTDKGESLIVAAIFDIWVGRNLTREVVMPALWSTKLQPIRAKTSVAADTSFTVGSVVWVQAKIGEHVTTAVFVVAPKRATKITLKTAFIDRKISKVRGIPHKLGSMVFM